MARFLKVNAAHETRGSSNDTEAHKDRWINIYTIDEICKGPGRTKLGSDGKPVMVDNERVYVDRTALKIVHPYVDVVSRTVHVQHAEYYVDGDPEDWAATIEAAIAADRFPPEPEADDEIVLNDRGVWAAGETYVPLDLAADPDNTSRIYLCLKENKSTSSGALANTSYWCEVSALAAVLP